MGTSSQLKSKQVIYDSLAYHYAIKCLNEDNTNVNKYIKKQCQQFIECIDSEEYYIDIKSLKAIEGFLKLINIMPNKNAYDNLVGFHWFFITNIFCVKRKSNDKKRYELSILLIARKNGRQKCLTYWKNTINFIDINVKNVTVRFTCGSVLYCSRSRVVRTGL